MFVEMSLFSRYISILFGIISASACVFAAGATAAPIVSVPPAPSLPDFSGKAFKATPVKGATKAPQNPYMAKNQKSNIHNDTWMSGTYSWPGPLGRNLVASSGASANSICSTIAFDWS